MDKKVDIIKDADGKSMWSSMTCVSREEFMLIATLVLGIGHIGIHIQHKKRSVNNERKNFAIPLDIWTTLCYPNHKFRLHYVII